MWWCWQTHTLCIPLELTLTTCFGCSSKNFENPIFKFGFNFLNSMYNYLIFNRRKHFCNFSLTLTVTHSLLPDTHPWMFITGIKIFFSSNRFFGKNFTCSCFRFSQNTKFFFERSGFFTRYLETPIAQLSDGKVTS